MEEYMAMLNLAYVGTSRIPVTYLLFQVEYFLTKHVRTGSISTGWKTKCKVWQLQGDVIYSFFTLLEIHTFEAMPRANLKKYLPSGYAPGYASGKISAMPRANLKKYLPSGYAPGYASGKISAMPRANLKKYLPSGYAPGYASGKISAMPRANLKKYLPSGYAPGYASGKISVKFKNFRDFPKYSRGLRPRLRLRQFLNIHPLATP
ncbi:hypothetical protein T12_2693 [Trichinella patagoniensis]|uniref:Uncharacterized protein n=1 Tax=Trichinella patagoniensis TaxID=990121 RepID=A0A0V0ZZ08_9BILA|nr:hypothetical protein T12_2693 [Trichinella patagoniensis]